MIKIQYIIIIIIMVKRENRKIMVALLLAYYLPITIHGRFEKAQLWTSNYFVKTMNGKQLKTGNVGKYKNVQIGRTFYD